MTETKQAEITTAGRPMRTAVLHPALTGRAGGANGAARPRRAPAHALAEAVNLARALSLDICLAEVVRVDAPRPGMLFGPGRVEELGTRLKADEVGLVIVDGPLSPVQQRNLERAWKLKILDRTGLILEIFADRARTREGVLQVDLAHLTYQKSRLVRSWTHLERQRGGLGFVGGPGETQIEADRRAISAEIDRIKRALGRVAKTRALHRRARARVPYPIVALVGYTNAGKSSLFNRLTDASVPAKDMLFATLDPTMRAVKLPSGRQIILSDTVGFVSDLPTELVAAFRATLEEVLEADLILHVRDIAHPESAVQAADVRDILATLGVDVDGERIAEIWNKIDILAPDVLRDLRLEAPGAISVSAATGEGIGDLLAAIEMTLAEPTSTVQLRIPFADGAARAWLHDRHLVLAERAGAGGMRLDVRWSAAERARFFAAHPSISAQVKVQ
ncbi:MAG: GTPase HflX [Pseudomonadota bacterium]